MTATPIELNEQSADTDLLLDIDNLTVGFPTDDGLVKAVRGVSYQLRAGESLGIVGESGSGKSVSSMALLGLLLWRGRLRAAAPEAELTKEEAARLARLDKEEAP